MITLTKAQASIALAFLFLATAAYSASALQELRKYEYSLSLGTNHTELVAGVFAVAEAQSVTNTASPRAAMPATSTGPLPAVSQACVNLERSLKRGEKGESVLKLQKALVDKGYLSSEHAIGEFGPRTQAAINKLQKDSGLEQTGNVGPLTRAKLRCAAAGYEMPSSGRTDVFFPTNNASGSLSTLTEREKAELEARRKFDKEVNYQTKESAEALLKKYNIAVPTAQTLASCVPEHLRADFDSSARIDIWDLIFLDKFYNKAISEITEPFYNFDKTQTKFGFDYLLALSQDFGKIQCRPGMNASTTPVVKPAMPQPTKPLPPRASSTVSSVTPEQKALAAKYGIPESKLGKYESVCTPSQLRGDFTDDGKVDVWDLSFMGGKYNMPISSITVSWYNAFPTATIFGFDYLLALAQDFGKVECASAASSSAVSAQ